MSCKLATIDAIYFSQPSRAYALPTLHITISPPIGSKYSATDLDVRISCSTLPF